jgi:hypothetical protein
VERHKTGPVKMRSGCSAALSPYPAANQALALAILLGLAGCASLSADLKTADGKCPQTVAVTTFVTCLNGVESPVWEKDSPQDAAAYRAFAGTRLDLAQDLDSGKITAAQFTQATADARAKFAAARVENVRACREQAARQRAEDDVESLQKPMPTAGDMGMNGGMGM